MRYAAENGSARPAASDYRVDPAIWQEAGGVLRFCGKFDFGGCTGGGKEMLG